MIGRLDGKVAFITGAGSGLGRAAAKLFASEGAKVILADVNLEAVETAAREIGGDTVAVKCDVSDSASVVDAVAKANDAFGTISVLYHNAGIDLGGVMGDGLTADLGDEAYDKTMGVNLRGTFFVTRAILPQMVANGRGSIINTASVAGALLGSSQHAYAMSKAGVVGLTRSVALSYAKAGVRANCICPGLARTPMTDFIFKDEGQRQRYVDGTPLGRVAEPEDIAPLALYLASDESSFMTGSIIPIDGGLTIH